MSLMKKVAVLGVAAEAARRFAKQNPDKARELTEKVARFADDQTKGRFSQQIEEAKQALASAGGFAEQRPAAEPPVTAKAEVLSPRPTPYKRS